MFRYIEYDPKKREVVKQTISIHGNGKVFWNEYILAPNFGYTLEKHRFKIDETQAQEIIKDVAKHFRRIWKTRHVMLVCGKLKFFARTGSCLTTTECLAR